MQWVVLFIFLLACSAMLRADEPLPKVLRWGADTEGGAPYIFQDPADPRRVIGYEADLVEALARAMNMTPQLVQNQWDGLVPGLQRGNYDIIVNGLEITEDRKAEINFSEPYYITYEQLATRKETAGIISLADCKGKIVGTLKVSLAERILQSKKDIQIRSYDGVINAYEDLANGRLDAVLMDHPIALYYGAPHRKLKLAGPPISQMAYGIGIRKEDRRLLGEINHALAKLIREGKLREILDRWALWNPQMSELTRDRSTVATPAVAYEAWLKARGTSFTWKERALQYLSYLPLLAKGAQTTVALSFLAMLMAVTLGLVIALTRLYTPAPFSQLALIYVEVMRGTPLLLQLFFIFYGLPNVGIKLTPFVAALLGLGLNYAAYEAENYRAGIRSIPRSQMEAALALGMTRAQALRHVIVPQAVRLVVPPVTNDFISLLKDSSLVSVITMVELTKVYGQLASTYYDYFGVGLLTAAMYLFIGLPFVWLSRYVERRFSFDEQSHKQRPAR